MFYKIEMTDCFFILLMQHNFICMLLILWICLSHFMVGVQSFSGFFDYTGLSNVVYWVIGSSNAWTVQLC